MRGRRTSCCLSLAVSVLLLACGSGAEDTHGGDPVAPVAVDNPSGTAPSTPAVDLLRSPNDPAMRQQAPAVFKVRFKTTRGDFVVEAHRDWAPHGADRFYNLSKAGYFDGIKLFRVVKGFMAQFGIHGDPSVSQWWMNATIADDPVTQSNQRGFITYAMTGAPNSRSTQLFINYGNNERLDGQGFAPFGQVVQGMETVDALFSEYGERTTSTQGSIYQLGNAFLEQNFPKLDAIITARLVD